VLLGSSLIWTGVESADWRSLAFAGLVLIGRPIVYSLALARTHLDRRSRWLMAWFGPRGLSTLLLVLLPPGAFILLGLMLAIRNRLAQRRELQRGAAIAVGESRA